MLPRVIAALLACALAPATALAQIEVPVIYLRQVEEQPPTLSNLDPIPEDRGVAGAQVGLADNATTGGFLGHNYSLDVVEVAPGDDWAAAAQAAAARSPFLILEAPAAAQQQAADLAPDAILFNASAPDTALRGQGCRANLLHTLPSYAMRADALMQFVQFKRWGDLALIKGVHPGDQAYAEALAASASKFGLKIGKEKLWAFDADMRRNASQEVPLFTQDLGDHDLLLIADELNDFGRYVAYNTWEARPVAGSEGLVPTAWARVVEQWGAAQLQSRFEDAAGRAMTPRDYAAWAAMRAIGEAVTRTSSAAPATLRTFMLSEQFELAGFKGRPLSFRTWNGQLRQPMPLVTRSALVAQAPLPGFLHQNTELDTLGIDQPESTCEAFQ